MMIETAAFSDTYTTARDRFGEAALAAGGDVQQFVNPNATGPAGETLSLDAAWFGPRDASAVLLTPAAPMVRRDLRDLLPNWTGSRVVGPLLCLPVSLSSCFMRSTHSVLPGA